MKKFLISLAVIILVIWILVYFIKLKNYDIELIQAKNSLDGVVENVYTKDCFPRELKEQGVTSNCFEWANKGQNIFCTSKEIKLIKAYYKNGQDKLSLDKKSGKFCAD